MGDVAIGLDVGSRIIAPVCWVGGGITGSRLRDTAVNLLGQGRAMLAEEALPVPWPTGLWTL